DAAFQSAWQREKHLNKICLAALIRDRTGVVVDPSSLFDIHVKRIHEYKRQHLNVLHILTLFSRIKRDPARDVVPRTFLFGGKAAPGYTMAKLMIRLITAVADTVNGDADVAGRLKVVFFPDFNVKHAQLIYPAADLSEQISLAGTEASGTGNMKLAMNGALTIGTLDGANIEIRDVVGPDPFFAFGLTAPEVRSCRARGYDPSAFVRADAELRDVLAVLPGLVPGQPDLFAPLVAQWWTTDPYMLMADYRSYVDRQNEVAACWRTPHEWARRAILGVARMGGFSSDRSIREYCERVWGIHPGAGGVPSLTRPEAGL
ncbi:MAG: glycogen/starch/alpha-glucan phosphorylase, partial [Vicinamibacterales bacterium]